VRTDESIKRQKTPIQANIVRKNKIDRKKILLKPETKIKKDGSEN
jgi:hypothetical protein